MTVQIETGIPAGLREQVAREIGDRLRAQLGVRIGVELVDPGALESPTGRLTQGKPKRFHDRREDRRQDLTSDGAQG